MSVFSSMTAIADKIRALLGTSEIMGLEEMATNLGIEQVNIENAFAAVSNKGGTVPTSQVSGNLASAINSIPAGVEVKVASGSFTTDNSGKATVNCGFQPDFVYITMGEIYDEPSFGSPNYRAGTIFEDSEVAAIYLWTSNTNYDFYEIYITRTSTGFSISGVWLYDASNKYIVAQNTSFQYVAVKYT